jgi:hypothetical protein
MQVRIGSSVAVLLGTNKRAATIEGFNGFSVSLLLDDGSRMKDIDLSRLVPPDVDNSHAASTPVTHGFDAGLNRDANHRIMNFSRRDSHQATIKNSVRCWYKTIAAVKSNFYTSYRLMTESKIFTDAFSPTALTDNWKYLTGTTGFSTSGGNLICNGGNLGNAIVPKYPAQFWPSHGLQFTAVTTTGNFQLVAGMGAGVMVLDFIGGTSIALSYSPTSGPVTPVQTVALATTIAAGDTITMFSFEKLVQIRKNNNIIAQFTTLVPGKVVTAWGFGDKYALTLNGFNTLGKAQGTRLFLPIYYTIQPQGATQGRFNALEQARIGRLDSNISPYVSQIVSVAYRYLPQPKLIMPIAYHVLGHTSTLAYVKYAVKQPILQLAAVIFKINQSVTKPTVVNYNIKVAIKSSAQFIYKVKAAINPLLIPVVYKIKSTINPLLVPISYGVKGSPGKTALIAYNVRALVGKSLTEITNAFGIATQVLTEIANTRQIAAKPLTEQANVASIVARTATEVANMFVLASKALTEPANIAQLAGKNLTEKANQAQAIAKVLTEQANVLSLVATTVTEVDNILGVTARTLTEVANTLGLTAKTLTEIANEAQVAGKPLTEQANVSATLARTLTELANVFAALGRTLTEQANVLQRVTKSVGVNYQTKTNYALDPWFTGLVTGGLAASWAADIDASSATPTVAAHTGYGGKMQVVTVFDTGYSNGGFLGITQNGIDLHGQSVLMRVRGRTSVSTAYLALYDATNAAAIYSNSFAVTPNVDFVVSIVANIPVTCTNLRMYIDATVANAFALNDYLQVWDVELTLV